MKERSNGQVTGKDSWRAWEPNVELSAGHRDDLQELREGKPLSRHIWLQQLRDAAGEQDVPNHTALMGMIQRLNELTSRQVRDEGLEVATVDIGFRFCSSPMYDGGFTCIQGVRSPEVYEDTRSDWEIYHAYSEPGSPHVKGPQLVKSDITAISGIYAGFSLGSRVGFTDEDAARWFMNIRADRIAVHVPLDAVTQTIPDAGSYIESTSERRSLFHSWEQSPVA